MIDLQELCHRYGINCVGLTLKQQKEALAEKLLKQRDPGWAKTLVPQLKDMPESALDFTVDRLDSEARFDLVEIIAEEKTNTGSAVIDIPPG